MTISGLLLLLSLGAPGPRAAATLPLVVLPPAAPPTHTLAILLTGDGGWAATDRIIAEKLAGEGDAVIGLNSVHYFAHPRTPDGLSADLSSIARDGCARWSCDRIVLIGYSLGADVLPFVVDKLASDVRPYVKQVQLISLSHEAIFHFVPTEWLGITLQHQFPTLPELARLRDVDVVCIYGTGDQDEACQDLQPGQATIVSLVGGHKMAKVADQLAEVVAEHLRRMHN